MREIPPRLTWRHNVTENYKRWTWDCGGSRGTSSASLAAARRHNTVQMNVCLKGYQKMPMFNRVREDVGGPVKGAQHTWGESRNAAAAPLTANRAGLSLPGDAPGETLATIRR